MFPSSWMSCISNPMSSVMTLVIGFILSRIPLPYIFPYSVVSQHVSGYFFFFLKDGPPPDLPPLPPPPPFPSGAPPPPPPPPAGGPHPRRTPPAVKRASTPTE